MVHPYPRNAARKPAEVPAYRLFGSGDPLVLIHGFMVNSLMFDQLIPFYEKQYQVIVPDLRGYGRSKDLAGPYTTDVHALDVINILNELGIEKAHIQGYSMGGTVAQYLGHRFGERVQTLTLACTFSFKSMTALERLQKSIIAEVLRRVGSKGIVRLISTQLSELAGFQLEPRVLLSIKRMLLDNDDRVLLQSLDEIYRFDYRPYVKRLAQPALVIGAGIDVVVPIHHQQFLAQQLPQCSFKVMPDAGHGIIHTHPDWYAQQTLELMNRHPLKMPG
jgi:pimeloyl-ACP methyl ester carboxylesterase